MTHEITDEQFKYFKVKCAEWQGKLGATDFILSFDKEGAEITQAEYSTDLEGRELLISITPELDDNPTSAILERCAFHEVFEGAVLQELKLMALDRYSSMEVERVTHTIVRKLENLFFGMVE